MNFGPSFVRCLNLDRFTFKCNAIFFPGGISLDEICSVVFIGIGIRQYVFWTAVSRGDFDPKLE